MDFPVYCLVAFTLSLTMNVFAVVLNNAAVEAIAIVFVFML